MPFVFFFCLVLFMFVRLSEVVDQINLKKTRKRKRETRDWKIGAVTAPTLILRSEQSATYKSSWVSGVQYEPLHIEKHLLNDCDIFSQNGRRPLCQMLSEKEELLTDVLAFFAHVLWFDIHYRSRVNFHSKEPDFSLHFDRAPLLFTRIYEIDTYMCIQ